MQLVAALRRLNTWEITGCHEASRMRVDDLVAEHVAIVHLLGRLTSHEEIILRLAVEGFTQPEIARECGCSVRTIHRHLTQLRWSFAATR